MRSWRRVSGIFAAALLTVAVAQAPASAAEYPNPGLVTGDIAVHDPAMVKAADGTYFLFSTGNGIDIRTSPDRTAFRRAGAVFPNGASWAHPFTGGSDNLWAPDVSFHNGRYYLYYSASTFGSRNSAIFLATSTTAQPGSWTNHGVVVQTNNSSDHNAIDPNLVVDAAGAWWLTYGSFWSGIKMVRIDAATGKPANSTRYSLAQRPSSADGAVEAPFIVHRSGYYYLFVSFDHCCRGTSSTYRVMVGRSTSITGPYTDRNGARMTSGGGTEVLATHGNIRGPGHPALMPDTDGWLMAYHYYTSSGSRLGVNLVSWSGGWPTLY
ncbi:arabinan endo-1,5-alpha-L-arabinosidase [Actinophytocola glycyrrhizae]|uniref:Arabinan endo-1,5-alpha-L-arabinosidase n=1 Tax=Actinophytocola glycyrrhizae TaxID=2044873 RepID=A0ABV9SB93_9PSEU